PSPPRQAKRGAPFSPRLMKTPRRATLSPKGARGELNLLPRPLGGEGGPPPAFLPAGAGRGRGSVHYPVVKYYAGHHTSLTPSTRSDAAVLRFPERAPHRVAMGETYRIGSWQAGVVRGPPLPP